MSDPAGFDPADAPAAIPAIGRRRFLGAAGIAGAVGIAAAAAGALVDHELADHADEAQAASPVSVDVVDFYGTHQAGIIGAAPTTLRFMAFDLAASADARGAVSDALKRLSAAAASMMAGRWIAAQQGIADGLHPAGLTLTVGIGPRLVALAGVALPATMAAIPSFTGDAIDPARSDGDLGVQIGGNDPLVVASVVQALRTLLAPTFAVRWMQSGFLPSASTTSTVTPRNLMGQLDGTDNPTGARLQLAVWAAPGTTPTWMVNGTYLVCRRIRMVLPDWFAQSGPAREAVIGRSLSSGAPLSGGTEHSVPDFAARRADGAPSIALDAHVRLAHPANNGGATMLRRGYSYDDGLRADGLPDAGLFFQAFQADPQTTFIAIQRRLAGGDALSRFIRHESSALFAVLPGVVEGGWLGQALFGP